MTTWQAIIYFRPYHPSTLHVTAGLRHVHESGGMLRGVSRRHGEGLRVGVGGQPARGHVPRLQLVLVQRPTPRAPSHTLSPLSQLS